MTLWMPLLWLTVLAAAMAIGQAHAVPCYYGDPASDEPGATTPHVYYDWANLGVAVYWYCDTGNQWTPVIGATAKLSEFDITAATSAITGATSAFQKQGLMDQVAAAATNTPYDAQLKATVLALPKPTKAPPSGLVTKTVFAYKLNSSKDNASLSIVGTVPLGTPCDATQSINGLYRIDRAKVKFPAGTLMPFITLADCKPK